MARTEVVAKRGARSKTFDNGDGTFTLEVGGGHAHHLKNGAWVETDCYLYGGNTEYTDEVSGATYTHETREHPVKIRLNKFKQPLRIGDVTLRPLDARQVSGVKSLNTVYYEQPWDGIDVKRIVTPEGLVEEITVTSAAGQRVLAWSVTGDLGDLTPPRWDIPHGGILDGGAVPYSFDGSILTYDLSGVPVGAVVR